LTKSSENLDIIDLLSGIYLSSIDHRIRCHAAKNDRTISRVFQYSPPLSAFFQLREGARRRVGGTPRGQSQRRVVEGARID
jgi:hypothetical protein